jgi:biotin carboxyl carrier protein
VLLESGLGNAVEEINPAELYDQMWRVTRMGEGGIPSMDAVPDSSRNVHSSQFGFVDPIATPESGRTGVDNRLAYNTRKGPGGLLYSRYLNPKTGREEWKSPRDILDTTVAFPQELESGEPYVRAIVKGKHRLVPRDKVDLQLVDMTEAMGPLANMVAMKHAAYPQRIAMGARMLTQALPMVNAEAPLVQSGIPGTSESFEDRLGEKMGAIRSQVAGTVINVTPETITIQGDGKKKHTIELYNDLPYNRKTTIHNTPLVSVGQHVKPGMLLAKSNFTDSNGTTALGLNYHVAFMPYKGYNYEDAIVMSESAAKRATSEHMYQHTLDTDDVQANKNTFVSIFPAKYPAKLLENYDENGVIKPGTTVNPDDPLILAVKERTTGPRVGRRRSWADASVSWHHEAPGVVTDVAQSKNGINVIVKSTQATQVGDKFANRYGGKGILSAIIPDDQMPRDANGRPFEILLNELGVISRQNPSQYIELMLGKVADKTGKPYKLPDYHTAGQLRRLAESELKKHQLSDTEDVEDPDTGRKISGIPTGKMFIMKLHHTAESKAQGRAAGGEAGYTAEGVPAKGGETGAKRVGTMELNALLSLGAYNVIRDAGVVRGQRNEDYWRQIMSGYHAPEPKVPFVYEKFMNQLKGAGINPVRTGTRINIMAMTNADVKHLTGNRKIQNSKTVDWRVDQLTPIYGGLFDERLTGGHDGKQWAYIQLTEAMPNPVMEDPIRYLLGLTKDQYEGIIAGRSHYGNDEPGIGVPKNTGPQAIAKALSELDIDKEMAKAKAAIDSGRKSDRDMAIRRYGYLKACKQNKQHPKDWMLDRAPVLPPMFRAVSKMQGSDRPMVADANYLYKELFDANEALTTMRAQVDDVSDERLAVYKALRAAVGLGDPIQPKSREQGVKGLLKEIFGSGPKWGMVQRKLLGATVDLVGGATITPNPNLDMDQVGLPVDKAWAIYKPFIVRSLVRRGMPKLQARREVEDRTPSALKALQHEMTQRPVMVTRAPALHRYNMLAFWPQLTRHNTLEVPPVVCGGFNADFDGDRMQFHVPADDSAVKDAIDKMLPSKNLLAASSFKAHYIPNREFLAGLWKASTKVDHNRPRRVYKTAQDAIKAYRRGEINADQQVEIVER